jgi:hypothetical protein
VTDEAGHCSFCGATSGPFSKVEGLFTVLICISCLEIRQAQPATSLGLHDPGPYPSAPPGPATRPAAASDPYLAPDRVRADASGAVPASAGGSSQEDALVARLGPGALLPGHKGRAGSTMDDTAHHAAEHDASQP